MNQQFDGNEISVILTYHSQEKANFENMNFNDPSEKVAYTLYFYSLHKIYIEELKNELTFTQTINAETTRDISTNRSELGFVNCPQFSLKPKIDYPSN